MDSSKLQAIIAGADSSAQTDETWAGKFLLCE
jgi:hypothetical protein